MAGTQRTGTQILALARLYAQDSDSSSNYGVGASDALVLLNAILADWFVHFGSKPKHLAATTTGLTFASGDITALTAGTTGAAFAEVISAHPASSTSLTFPLAKPLERVSVDEIVDMLGYDGNTALAAQASEWTHFAAERAAEDDGTQPDTNEKWRIWTYPVINRTRYMTLRVSPYFTALTAITEVPDIDEGDASIVSRLLAHEIAKLKKENSQEFLNGILRAVPKEVLDKMYRAGVHQNQLPSSVEWRDW